MAYTADFNVVICSLKIVYLFFSLNCLNILTLNNVISLRTYLYSLRRNFSVCPQVDLNHQPADWQLNTLANCTTVVKLKFF